MPWNFLQRSKENFNKTGYMQELYQYFIWKVQMLNCHYSAVWLSHSCFCYFTWGYSILIPSEINYSQRLLRSVLYTFCHLWICFNLFFNYIFSKVMNICCWQKGVSFFDPATWPSVVFADYQNLSSPIQGISWCFWTREFPLFSSHYRVLS